MMCLLSSFNRASCGRQFTFVSFGDPHFLYMISTGHLHDKHLMGSYLCCRGTRPQGLGSCPRLGYHLHISETGSGTSQTFPEVPTEVPEYRKPLAKKLETSLGLGTPFPGFGDLVP